VRHKGWLERATTWGEENICLCRRGKGPDAPGASRRFDWTGAADYLETFPRSRLAVRLARQSRQGHLSRRLQLSIEARHP